MPLTTKQLLSVVANDPQRKSYSRILLESVRWIVRERELPQHYFSQLLYRSGRNPSNYIGRKRCFRIRRQFFYRGIEQSLSYLENKQLFWLHLKSSDIPIVDVMAYSTQHGIFDARSSRMYALRHPEDVSNALSTISSDLDIPDIFAKPAFGLQGNACILFRQAEPVNRSPDGAFRLLRRYPYVFQPRIEQHPDLDAVNSSSVNTIRINVFYDRNRKRRVLTPFAKFGSGGAIVDNAGTGGIILALDAESGCASGAAFRFLKEGGATYNQHPDTHYPFDEFEAPHFAEACSVALRASELFPHRFIGWDIAITRDGPVIVEGNSGPNLDCIQTLVGGFRDHPEYSILFQRFI